MFQDTVRKKKLLPARSRMPVPITIFNSTLLASLARQVLAIDVTGRNLQDEAKKLGLPWSTAKGFDTFTPIG